MYVNVLPETTGKRARPRPLLAGAARAVVEEIVEHIEDGRFQRSLALVTAGSSLVSGLEVGYEHYKGSYSNPVMYTPLILSGLVSVASVGAVFDERMAQGPMRWISLVTLVDGVIGFGFHVRGIKRKPGGWKLPITNI